MSQCGNDPTMKKIPGTQSKIKFENYTDEELADEEFFWNQLKLVAQMKNVEYFYFFMNSFSNFIEKQSGM